MQKKLAIVIPYYKIDFFEETLQSVAEQNNRYFTLYIGNDKSPNDPLPLIEKYFSPLDYRYYSYGDNLGGKNLASQWERILENVEEEWFQILGDDDLISENFVEEFYKNLPALIQQKSSTVRINHIQIDENGVLIKDLRNQEKITDPKLLFYCQYTYEISSTLSENIFRTEIYRRKKFKHIPLAWGSDHLAIFDFADGNPIFYLTEALVEVRISSESISGSTQNLTAKKKAYQIYRQTIINRYFKILDHRFILSVFKDYRNTAGEMKTSVPLEVATSLLQMGEWRIALSIIKKNIIHFNTQRKVNKYLTSQNQYKFDPNRYSDTFLGSRKNIFSLKPAPEKIFCFWTGNNCMSDNRLHSLQAIKKNTGTELILVTPDNLNSFIISDSPVHPSFENLSLVHKSDYLRGYFMYHHGGGYTDLKSHDSSWKNVFKKLNSSENSIAVGYREDEARYVGYAVDFVDPDSKSIQNLNIDLSKNVLYLIGNGSYIFKPKSSFWKEWLDEVHARLDKNAQQLEKNPGNMMGDNEGYPLPWTSILGQVFHPLCLKYHTELLYDDQIKPVLKNYR